MTATAAIYASRQPTTPSDLIEAAQAAAHHRAWTVEDWARPGLPRAIGLRAPGRHVADWVIARSDGRVVALAASDGELLGSFDAAAGAVELAVWLHATAAEGAAA